MISRVSTTSAAATSAAPISRPGLRPRRGGEPRTRPQLAQLVASSASTAAQSPHRISNRYLPVAVAREDVVTGVGQRSNQLRM
jgi:hypothetical protein